jgi:DNA-binding NarL/FixJ family response regulator
MLPFTQSPDKKVLMNPSGEIAKSIFIVEDHPSLRENLVLFCSRKARLTISGAVGSGQEALTAVPSARPDLVLIDFGLPDMDGIELVKCLLAQQPDLRCLIFSGLGEEDYAQASIDAGAWGYLMKGDSKTILQAITTVLAGEIYISERMYWHLNKR